MLHVQGSRGKRFPAQVISQPFWPAYMSAERFEKATGICPFRIHSIGDVLSYVSKLLGMKRGCTIHLLKLQSCFLADKQVADKVGAVVQAFLWRTPKTQPYHCDICLDSKI